MKAVANQNCIGCAVYKRSVFNESELSKKLLYTAKKQFKLHKGEYLFKEGTLAEGVFCIRAGRLFIFKKDDKGNQHVLTDASKGELLGIAAVTDGLPFSTSARAAEDTEVCLIPREIFIQLIAVCPSVSKASLKMLSGKLNKLDTF